MLHPIAFTPGYIESEAKCTCGFTTGAGTGDCKCGWAVGNGFPEPEK